MLGTSVSSISPGDGRFRAIATLYDRLGVGPRASQAEIRSAYRSLARRLHPDHGSGQSAEAMAAVNEAWRVLGDPGRRASYDASLTVARAAAVAPAPTVDRSPGRLDADDVVTPDGRSFWAVVLPGLLVLVVLGAIFLFTAYARGGVGGGSTSAPANQVDGVIEVDSCVVLDAGARAMEAPCAGPHVGVVSAIVGAGAACPLQTEGFYSVDGVRLFCITRD